MIEEKVKYLNDKYSKVIFNDSELEDYIIAIVSKVMNVDKEELEKNFEIKSTEIEYDRSTKRSVADAIYETDKDIINLEINLNKSEIVDRKNYRYVCQLISKQVKIGDANNYFKKITQINLNDYDMFKKGEFIYKSVIMEEKYHIKRNDFLTIYDVSLDYLRGKEYNDIQKAGNDSLERLLYILVCNNEDANKLYSGDDLMEKVNEKLGGLSGADLSDLRYDKEEFDKAVFKDVAFHRGIEKVAKSLLENNVDLKTIIKSTGLTEEEINDLKQENN